MTVKIGLVGTGTVGGGCLDIYNKHKDDFKRHYGVDMAGKHVVTANKALMATYGVEVTELAREMHKELAFEASVGGGIPIIDPLKHSLISNEVSSVLGIVNGTTNYMLTRMDKEGIPYDEVLADAQAKGFAEADPTADVDGFDAAAKIAILASIAFNSRVVLSDVSTEGIRNVQPVDLKTAHDMGYVVKLLAIAHRTDEGVDVRVHPTMIPDTHQLAHVNGVDNAIYVTGDAVGETMFFGAGAGASWATCSRFRVASCKEYLRWWAARAPTSSRLCRWTTSRPATTSGSSCPIALACLPPLPRCSRRMTYPCALSSRKARVPAMP